MSAGRNHRRASRRLPRPRFVTAFAAAAGAAVVGCALALPTGVRAVEIMKKDDFSLDIGLRIQPRMEFERGTTSHWQRDLQVRRTRLKLGGDLYNAKYKFEWKIDSTDRIGATPSGSVENAYIQYPLGSRVQVRAGLYDQPYSRDRLTSDSRQFAVDRSTVSNEPDAVGLADNAVGFHFLSRFADGRVECAAGMFDNRLIPGALGAEQNMPMLVGRIDLNFGSTKDVFQDAHFGGGSWYSVGFNGNWQGEIQNAAGLDNGSNGAAGADGMIDVPAGPGRLCARGEVNVLRSKPPVGGNPKDTVVWMLGLGYLTWRERLQPVVRFDQVRRDDAVGGATTNVAYVGANWYRKGHSLKLQGDVRFDSGSGDPVDGVRLQAQVDY